MLGEITLYTCIYNVSNPFNMTPSFIKEDVESGWQVFVEVLKESFLIVESMAQSASDTVEQKGLSYAMGNITFE